MEEVSKLVQNRMRMLRLNFMLKPVRVMVLKDLGVVSLDGVELELRKGVELELPRWLAELLVENGYAEYVETPITLQDIARIHFSTMSARNPGELEQLPKDFYNMAREYYLELSKRVRKELSPVILEERSKAASYLSEIVNKRITFILQVMRSPALLADIYQKLSPEEQVLLDTMHKLLDAWKTELLGFIEE
ncbi:MAG: hypothetical protein ABWW69_01940 [Pyrodictiaceae archaeon]